jgi:acetyl esterase/lipase
MSATRRCTTSTSWIWARASAVSSPRTRATSIGSRTTTSPLTHVERIQKPLLIGQGANDPRVKQQESDQIVAAMQARGIPVTYALFPDEGHGFVRPENDLAFNAVAEAFLGACLGGRIEPIGDDLLGSSIQVVTGAERIQGLAQQLGPGGSTPAVGSAPAP